MGGGGFTAGPVDPALDDLVLRLTGVPRPRLCLLRTAGGDSEHQIRRFYETYGDRLCEPSHISLFRLGRHPVPLRERLLAQDAVYVGGGSMVNLLAIWKAQKLDVILREAWEAGVVMTGLSAGSLCWFEHGMTAFHGESRPVRGMGLLPYSNAVHYEHKPERRSAFLTAVADGMISGYGTGDGAALHFVGTELAEVVTSRPDARAFHVTRDGETELGTRYLERTLAAA